MPVKSLFTALDMSASGLTATRRWMDAIAENLANAQTTRTPDGGPYRRKTVTFHEVMGQARRVQVRPGQERPELSGSLNPEGAQAAGSARRGLAQGVEAVISRESGSPRMVYDPDHPDADEQGMVAYPDVQVVREMADLITASRSYEANITALNAAKAMNKKALEI
ncbi:MAG: flagellar basal body rod protein FlgC [Candidatus Zixiibacteriota bacterium]|nr:MAG: flagellar basal body rod protein FlgC [candidate division Zixibacteria bacterium]